MLTNRTQSRVSISGLTYNNLIEDAYNAIKDSEEFKNSFSTFTSNEAARMIVELYAYVANQLANRMDQMGNELFVDTASRSGLSRLLKLVGAKVDFPAAAETEVKVSTSATTNPFILSYGIDLNPSGGGELVFNDATSFKSVTANNGTTWEFIRKEVDEESGEYVYNYAYSLDFVPPTETYTLYEGTTHASEYTIRTINPDIITLNGSIIKDSIRIYYKSKELASGTTSSYEIKEMKKVDNFFTTAALTASTGIYTVRNTGNGAEICIKAYSNSDNSANDIGKDIIIMYRTGGGSAGNIAIGSISKIQRFNRLEGTNNTVTGIGELTITNISAGNGGKDELTTNEIRSTVVNEVRNTKIAITEEDYEYLLPKYDNNIGLLKCYGEKNEEIADLAETYGYYVNPIAAWFIILKRSTEFEDAYANNSMGLTKYINDIVLNILDINPRFDEQYQVNTASLNQVYKASELKDYYTESSRQYIFPINAQGVEALSDTGANSTITITNAPYIDSALYNKRRESYFNKDVADSITWKELLSMDVGIINENIYRITDEDAENGINYRWTRKALNKDRWTIQDVNVSENGKYISVTSGGTAYYVYAPSAVGATKYDITFTRDDDGYYIQTSVDNTVCYIYIPKYYNDTAEYYYNYEPGETQSTYVVDTPTQNKVGPYVKRTATGNVIYYVYEGLVTKYTVASVASDDNGDYIMSSGHYVYKPNKVSGEVRYTVAFSENTNGDYLQAKTTTATYYLYDSAERYDVTFRTKTSSEEGKYRRILENYDDFWERVEFDYVYDNLISSQDGDNTANMYIQQNGGGASSTFSTVYSMLSESFSAKWEDILAYYSQSGTGLPPIDLSGIVLTINGVEISFDSPALFNSLSELIEYINARVNPSVQRVLLKSNISGLEDNAEEITITAGEGFVAGETGIVLKLNSQESTLNFDIDVSSVNTYGDLVDAINDVFEDEGYGNKFKAVLGQNGAEECYDLWIICNEGFQYKDSSTSDTSAIYKYLLGHLTYDGSWIDSESVDITDSVLIEAWADFLEPKNPLVRDNDGSLELCFDENGDSTIKIEGTNASWLREAFGATSIDESTHSRKNSRQITVSYLETSAGEYSAQVIISMASDTDVLKDDIYINVFGKAKDEIKLGSYYENITTKHPVDISDNVAEMLHRDPIKALYSTSYTSASSTENVDIDKYGCNYQLKFSTGVVGEKTYNELSSGNFPAYINTTQPSYNTFRKFNDDEYLYMKVDGIEYDGSYSFEQKDDAGNIYERKVVSEAGYAKFNLSWFNSVQVSEFIKIVVNTFAKQGEESTPLLGSILIEDDLIRIYTTSAAYYSSISFGNTLLPIVSYLFGINTNVVESEEGQINVDQIRYSYLSLTDYPAIGKEMIITYTSNGGISTSKNVSVGYQSTSFSQNVLAAFPDEQILVNSKRLILADLSNTAKMKVEIEWANQVEKDAWEGMFADLTWESFVITEEARYRYTADTKVKADKAYYIEDDGEYIDAHLTVGADIPQPNTTYYEQYFNDGSAYCEYVNSGDYYINLTKDESGNNVYMLKVENATKFPFGNVYIHMYEDYSFDHIVSSEGNRITYTDEYNWNRLMANKRVMLTEHVYKQPRFIPFDIAITCYLPNTEALSKTDTERKNELEAFLRSEYGVYANNIGKKITDTEIRMNIKNSFSNVSDINIDYLGYDMLTAASYKAELKTDFNQQHIIATYEESTEAVTDEETGRVSFDTVVKHGLKINLVYRAV